MIIVKIYLEVSLELLWAVWCQFSFKQFLVSAYTFQDLQPPSNVVSVNYRVLICCSCHFQGSSSVYFGFFCLQFSSVPNFCPDTRGRMWSLIQAYLFSCAVWREEHCKQISLACVGSACSVLATLGLPLLKAYMLSQSTLLRLQVALQGTYLKWALGCMHFPGLNHSDSRFRFSGTPQRHRLSWACVLCPPRSKQLMPPGVWWVHSPQVGSTSYHLPAPRHLVPGCPVGVPSQVCSVSPLGC